MKIGQIICSVLLPVITEPRGWRWTLLCVPLKKGSGLAGKDMLLPQREQGKLLENTVKPL